MNAVRPAEAGELLGSDWSLPSSGQWADKDAANLDKQFKLGEQSHAARLAHDSYLQAFLVYALQTEELPPEEGATNVAVSQPSEIEKSFLNTAELQQKGGMIHRCYDVWNVSEMHGRLLIAKNMGFSLLIILPITHFQR